MSTFMGAVRAGEAQPSDIDAWIARWHDDPSPFGPKLHEFLGLIWDEYKRWVETSELPGFSTTRRRAAPRQAPGGATWSAAAPTTDTGGTYGD